MTQISTVGIDLAKQVCSVHGVDRQGRPVLRRTIKAAQLAELVANLPPCLIGMESCSGAHDWARRFQVHGHEVRLIAPRFIAAYRKGDKNDGNDADAICEAVGRPSMRFVPIKSVEQQAILTVHRVRQGFVTERTAIINRIRGLMAEFGVVMPLRPIEVRRRAPALLEGLPTLAAGAIADLYTQFIELGDRVRRYDRQIAEFARQSDASRRLMARPGIGKLTASAFVASVGAAREFRNGRQFAAWLGLVPRQYSTGGKTRLGRITKRGDTYLRTLLILGARHVVRSAARHQNSPVHRWALEVKERRGWNKACVAVAAKNARVVWALLSHPEPDAAQAA